MLVIRLARVGRENLQHFRLVVQEKTYSPKSGKVVATVGSYDPTNKENKLIFDVEKIEKFIQNGAAPSDTVARLLLKNSFKKELVEKFVKKYSKQKSRKSEASTKPADNAAPTEPTTNEEPTETKTKNPEESDVKLETKKEESSETEVPTTKKEENDS